MVRLWYCIFPYCCCVFMLALLSGCPRTVRVPLVVGQTEAAARTAIEAANLTVGTVTEASSDAVAAGSVISQDPTAGTNAARGSAVDFVVSSGPSPVLVPNVLGQFRTNAEAAIVAAGLTVGTVTEEMSCTVFDGNVINQFPDFDTPVPPGSAVSLVISIESVTVFGWIGQTQPAATSDIVFRNLTVGTITEDYDDTILNGHVLSTDPAQGECVLPGTAVNIVMSLGPAPIEINDAEELQKIGHDPGYRLDGNYDLAGNIDASTTGKGGAGFDPIGSSEAPFTGRFFGHSFTISGLTINRPEEDAVGLFGQVGVFDDPTRSGLIQDLNVSGGGVTGRDGTGALCGSVPNGVITNCHASTSVTGHRSSGGLIGGAGSQVTVDSCSATGNVFSTTLGDVSAADDTGGLIGTNFGTVVRCSASGNISGVHAAGSGGLVGQNLGSITDCIATGDVNVPQIWAGGLIGLNFGTVDDCQSSGNIIAFGESGGFIGWNSGPVSRCISSGSVTVIGVAGGLIGLNTDGSVTECVAEGSVLLRGTPEFDRGDIAGGLIGKNQSNADHPILRCYALGAVSGRLEVGGLVGTEANAGGGQGDPDFYGPIIQCYAAGAVDGANDVGGLVGKIRGTSDLFPVSDSFWDMETTGLASSHGGGTGLSTAAMMQQASFTAAGWDFVDDWGIDEGVSYPFLLWLAELE